MKKYRARIRSDFISDFDGDAVMLNSHLQVCDHESVDIDTGLVTQHGHPIIYTIDPEPIGFFRFEEVDEW